MEALLHCCCGVDVHKDMIETCIIRGTDNPEFIRKQFSTMPESLREFVTWLSENDCYHIAMESTGVYWRPVYEAIEEYSEYVENVMVVNAHHMRNLPGRKTDVKDAEWIATLLQHGLLEHSYVPEKIIRILREYTRLYNKFVKEKSCYVNRTEKFLQAHGFKLSSVLSDIFTVSGTKMLRRLAQTGILSVEDVKECCTGNLKHTPEEIQAAISGKLNAYEKRLLGYHLDKVETSKLDIQAILADMQEMAAPYQTALQQMDSIPGIDTTAALLILGEIGYAPHENFDSPERLCSWAGLTPRNDQSAGKIKSKKVLHGNPYIKAILCQVAWAAVKTRKTPFGQWFWSHQVKIGRKKAIIAISRKILSLIFHLLRSNTFYDPEIAMKPYTTART